MKQFFGRVLLPLAAVVIVAACAWKIASPDVNLFASGVSRTRMMAPSFALYDQNSRLFNLDAYLHRHDIILVFFEADRGIEGTREFETLLSERELLTRHRVITVGISTVLPQENRQAAGDDFPFTLLTDLQAEKEDSASRRWGCVQGVDSYGTAQILSRVFHIDRAGTVASREGMPAAESDVAAILQRIQTGI